MKFKKFMEAIYTIQAELPSEVKLPSEEWFKSTIPKKDRKNYLASARSELAFFKLVEKLGNNDEPVHTDGPEDEQYDTRTETDNEDVPTGIDATLAERGTNYGQFADFAGLAQKLKSTFDSTVLDRGQPELFTNAMNEAIEMCFHKLARIGTGNPLYLDSARDLVGYAQLLVNEIEAQEDVIDTKVTKLVKEDGEWVLQ